MKEFYILNLMQDVTIRFHSYGVLTMSVMQRDGTGLHGDPPDLFILPAVQISQLITSDREAN